MTLILNGEERLSACPRIKGQLVFLEDKLECFQLLFLVDHNQWLEIVVLAEFSLKGGKQALLRWAWDKVTILNWAGSVADFILAAKVQDPWLGDAVVDQALNMFEARC